MAKKRNFKRGAKKPTPNVESDSEEMSVPDTPEAPANSSISAKQTVLLKVCRLCESKDGPFLDIFDVETMTAKKIQELMPFVVVENDDLPQKICFRCSAKVEELYEFVQKCIKVQENLHMALGKSGALTTKPKDIVSWEESLKQNNISNDDICNALIKRAMKGIKNFATLPLEEDDEYLKLILKQESKMTRQKQEDNNNAKQTPKVEENSNSKLKNEPDGENNSLKQESIIENMENPAEHKTEETDKVHSKGRKSGRLIPEKKSIASEPNNPVVKTNTFSVDDTNKPQEETPKPFNIMDHVSMIKVNDVGILFQCKLCNRNFLKKEVVMSHACAKNGGKKIAEEVKTIAPAPPKMPLIKYINTKPPNETNKPAVQKTNLDSNKQIVNMTPINIDDDDDDQPLRQQKPKPRIGPASKVRRLENDSPAPTPIQDTIAPKPPPVLPTVTAPSVQLPFGMPQLNSRYKLVPGTNNSFMLVEDKSETTASPEPVQNTANVVNKLNISQNITVKKTKQQTNVPEQPYPVGLIKTGLSNQTTPLISRPESFTTPAMKKQSYTIVPTGNPSKLLISTKTHYVEETPKKKSRKTPPEENGQKPYSVTLEDASRPESSYFTFVNVDPLLQPSYVLPTDNTIQESQISTSTAKAAEDRAKDNIYACNMCDEKFSREKKLLTHIQSHYNKMDEEDQLRRNQNSSNTKKRKRT